MNRTHVADAIQPGLIPVFRFFGWLQLVLSALYGAVVAFTAQTLSLALFVPLLSATGLLAVLCIQRLERWLGRLYLPLIILYAIIHIIVLFGLGWQIHVTTPAMHAVIDEVITTPFSGGSSPFSSGSVTESVALLIVVSNLFFILLLVSWQYDMRGVLWFCLAATTLDLVVNVALVFDQSALVLPNIGIILSRNVIFLQIASVIRRLLYIQREQRAALIEANTQLVRYAITAEELATSKERDRLARELHDTLAHTLSAATVQLEAAQARWTSDSEKAKAAVEKTLHITRHGLVETRRALKALRASPLEDVGFVHALTDVIELLQQRSRATITFAVSPRMPSLTPEIEHTIYRAAQETLENAVRHASASHINLTINATPHQLRMQVQDDGVGFDTARALRTNDRFGLRGMHERVRALGGEMTLLSEPGKGTSVHMEVPL